MTTNTQYVTTETLLELVADPQRRAVLRYLRENGEHRVTLERLTENVETGADDASVRHPSRGSGVVFDLHHHHLAKLDDAGVVEYDWSDRTVRYRPNDRVEELLEFVSTQLGHCPE